MPLPAYLRARPLPAWLQVTPGPLELTYPITIKGAPPVLVTLRAHVQVPDLKLSSELLDFGACQTGQCKVFSVQLHNAKQVPCEWAVKRPVEVTKTRDWQFFVCEPSEGVLEPDQRVNMKVGDACIIIHRPWQHIGTCSLAQVALPPFARYANHRRGTG